MRSLDPGGVSILAPGPDRAQTGWTVVARAVPAVVLATPVSRSPLTPTREWKKRWPHRRRARPKGARCQTSYPHELPLLFNPRDS
jgi:hypothetical protein